MKLDALDLFTERTQIGHHDGDHGGKSLKERNLVPKKGLEPPHPCEYMDLNHARLPIPPLRHYVSERAKKYGQQQLVYKSRW